MGKAQLPFEPPIGSFLVGQALLDHIFSRTLTITDVQVICSVLTLCPVLKSQGIYLLYTPVIHLLYMPHQSSASVESSFFLRFTEALYLFTGILVSFPTLSKFSREEIELIIPTAQLLEVVMAIWLDYVTGPTLISFWGTFIVCRPNVGRLRTILFLHTWELLVAWNMDEYNTYFIILFLHFLCLHNPKLILAFLYATLGLSRRKRKTRERILTSFMYTCSNQIVNISAQWNLKKQWIGVMTLLWHISH